MPISYWHTPRSHQRVNLWLGFTWKPHATYGIHHDMTWLQWDSNWVENTPWTDTLGNDIIGLRSSTLYYAPIFFVVGVFHIQPKVFMLHRWGNLASCPLVSMVYNRHASIQPMAMNVNAEMGHALISFTTQRQYTVHIPICDVVNGVYMGTPTLIITPLYDHIWTCLTLNPKIDNWATDTCKG